VTRTEGTDATRFCEGDTWPDEPEEAGEDEKNSHSWNHMEALNLSNPALRGIHTAVFFSYCAAEISEGLVPDQTR
jgi:hypothetical protein